MSQSIFINSVTVIDCARFSPERGEFVGDSFNLHTFISGDANGQEEVVVDFSSGKKLIKAAIDGHVFHQENASQGDRSKDNGYDHKTWITEDLVQQYSENGRYIELEGPKGFRMAAPSNAVKILPKDVLTNLEGGSTKELQYHIKGFLEASIPGFSFEVFLDRSPFTNCSSHLFGKEFNTIGFQYLHGLKQSTSYGCQNIFHGHGSVVSSEDLDAAIAIAKYLDGGYLYEAKSVSPQLPNFAYETPERGAFSLTISEDPTIKLIDIGGEPTIENLSQHVAQVLQIRAPFLISEGLQKGAYYPGKR
jgi:hypothetical protein